jgi:flagellar biosynthetic protein FlhB
VADDVERSEQPTAKRREDARSKGQLAISQEAYVFANLLVVSIVLLLTGREMLRESLATFQALWVPVDSFELEDAVRMLGVAFAGGARAIGPVLLATFAAAVVTGQLQTRGNVAPSRLAPKLAKISPQTNLSRVIKKQGPIDLAKSIAKLALVGTVAWLAIAPHVDAYLGLWQLPLLAIMDFQLTTILWAYLYACGALLVIAAADYGYQYFQNEKQLRMSRFEVKEERRQSEGDPLVRSRQRSLQFERARNRMMKAVPDADVVVTNPEHISIALRYERPKMAAPRVVARGAGILALRIREIAREHGVPIVENKPLARALYRSVKVGRAIPENLFQAVAELLAYEYRLNPRKARAW